MASILEIVDEQAKEKFPAGWKALKPYLRVTPPPDKAGQSYQLERKGES